MNEKYTFSVNKICEVSVELNENVFKPTGTSEELVKAVSEQIEKPGKLLDLGCGSGVVAGAAQRIHPEFTLPKSANLSGRRG